MTDKEFLKRIEEDHVEQAEHLARESEAETKDKGFVNLGIRKLEDLEDDTWKRVLHVDESLDVVRKRINEVCYYDEQEMPNKLGMVMALLEYERRILVARRKLTDDVIRTIHERELAVMRADSVRKAGAFRTFRGGPGDDEE